MPQTSREIILGPKKDFTDEELMQLVETRRQKLVKLFEAFQFVGMIKFDSIEIGPDQRRIDGRIKNLRHELRVDEPAQLTRDGSLPLDTYGMFNPDFHLNVTSKGRENLGWGITKKGSWVVTRYTTRILQQCAEFESYVQATGAGVFEVPLAQLVDELESQNEVGRTRLLMHLWSAIEIWVSNTHGTLQSRADNLKQELGEMMEETRLIREMSSQTLT